MGQLKIRFSEQIDTLKKITLYIAPPLFTWCLRHGHNQTHPGSSAPYQRTLPWLSGRQIPWCCPQRKSAQPLLGWYHHWSADGGSWTQATGSWTSGNLRDESDAPYLPVFTLNLTGPNTAPPFLLNGFTRATSSPIASLGLFAKAPATLAKPVKLGIIYFP